MYAYGGDQWIAYDDQKTIGIKAQYIKDKVSALRRHFVVINFV